MNTCAKTRRPRRLTMEIVYEDKRTPLSGKHRLLPQLNRFARDHFDLHGKWPTRVRLMLAADRKTATTIVVLEERAS